MQTPSQTLALQSIFEFFLTNTSLPMAQHVTEKHHQSQSMQKDNTGLKSG